jgi:hypothetical protein
MLPNNSQSPSHLPVAAPQTPFQPRRAPDHPISKESFSFGHKPHASVPFPTRHPSKSKTRFHQRPISKHTCSQAHISFANDKSCLSYPMPLTPSAPRKPVITEPLHQLNMYPQTVPPEIRTGPATISRQPPAQPSPQPAISSRAPWAPWAPWPPRVPGVPGVPVLRLRGLRRAHHEALASGWNPGRPQNSPELDPHRC